jgi:hypothetical protein
MIPKLKLELATTKTREEVEEFLVSKCYFKQNPSYCEKLYPIGRDSLREALMIRASYTDKGLFVEYIIPGFSSKATFVEPSGRVTRAMTEFSLVLTNLKKASSRVEDDLKDIEKFLKG